MARSAATGIIFIIAGLWTLWTILVFAIALFYQLVGLEDGPDSGAANALYMCSVVNFIVMVLLIFIWHTKKKNEDQMDELASYLRMYRRTPLNNVAARMNIDLKTTELLLSKCISKGHIHGFLDRNTNEFILKESIIEMKTGSKCPNCGGFTTDVSFPGEVVKCQFCDAVIPDHSQPPPPPPQAPKAAHPGAAGRIMMCSQCRKEIPLDSNLCPYCGQRFG